MKITNNFTLDELLRSKNAAQNGILNTPTPEHTINLVRVTENCLQRIRDHFGVPVDISSGYRSAALNKITKGASSTSQHCKGQAIDFTVRNHSIDEVIAWCRKNLTFDQIIREYGSWVHISYVHDGKNRKQVLRTDDGVRYIPI